MNERPRLVQLRTGTGGANRYISQTLAFSTALNQWVYWETYVSSKTATQQRISVNALTTSDMSNRLPIHGRTQT